MPLPQQKFREVVFQMLYSLDVGPTSDEEMLPFLMKESATTKKTVKNAQERVREILAKKQEIDEKISKTSRSYLFERIQTVERNILRIGVFELLYDQKIPPKVAIAEAIRLARKFGTPESSSFVNAILDALYKASIGEEVDLAKLHESVQNLTESEELTRKAVEDSSLTKPPQKNSKTSHP
jgi:N utilization substance protein B